MNLSKYAPLMLRLSLAIVFLWFGVDKFVNPGYWYHQVPQLMREILGITNGGDYGFIHSIGVFEILMGAGLTLGVFTRYVATIASVFLFSIIVTTGLNPATVRDIGLLGISLYLASTSVSKPVFPSYLKRGKRLLALSLVAATAVAVPLAMGINGSNLTIVEQTERETEPALVFMAPIAGETLYSDNVEVKLKINFDLRKLGVSHIHFKLDGKVIDVVYPSIPDAQVSIILDRLRPGEHILSAYLAYIDHSELPEYTASINFSVAT